MTRTYRLFYFLSLTWLLAIGAELRAADAPDYGTAAGSIVVPAGITAKDVEKCILEAAIGRGWTIQTHETGKVVIALDQDKWSSRLTLLYTTTDVNIFSKSTRSGKPRLPETWINFLKRDITAKLATLSLLRS
ncbi:MAG TPA: hypothetical protein VFT72_08100 [Opitutaceae bacterium]|nr:hypothetical protein [Opitutaceae bacterium]